MSDNTYQQKIFAWRQGREDSIRKENGWLALYGLFWLKPGKNRIGSNPEFEINLPKRAPDDLGCLEYNGKSVTLQAATGQSVIVNDKIVTFANLETDEAEYPSYIKLNDLCLVVIQRGNRMGVRIWDNLRSERSIFPPRTWYDINTTFYIPGRYTAYAQLKITYFPSLLTEKTEIPVDGYISFKYGGRSYQLDVTQEDEASFFIRFWDPTCETETYPSGRYLIARIEKDDRLMLDFNYAYNPPCAFTDFATCVFAPEQNRLDFKIEAGETYQHH
jgi:uncharacterized protein (DUF1684 family)